VWLAAVWGRHVHHATAANWLDRQEEDLALCRVTQMSLLSLMSNPAVMGQDVLWTDDYLAAFAQAADATLATLDRKLHNRYPSIQVVTLT
jgi:predicted nucleic acid-binding protein